MHDEKMWVFVHIKKIPVNDIVYGDSEERERPLGRMVSAGLGWALKNGQDSDRKALGGGKF